jgi:hypothetical protein
MTEHIESNAWLAQVFLGAEVRPSRPGTVDHRGVLAYNLSNSLPDGEGINLDRSQNTLSESCTV